ncbi:MAG TPA: hypothetical protein VEJ84_05780 [Acidimicrobiales bacterium]|nr:hypothetical protein [Acidimicrobiales bacterium]
MSVSLTKEELAGVLDRLNWLELEVKDLRQVLAAQRRQFEGDFRRAWWMMPGGLR